MSSHPYVQDVNWAKKTSAGEALETRCMSCASVAASAWPSLSWESLVLKTKSDSAFRQEVKTALRVKAGMSTTKKLAQERQLS